MNLKPLYDRVLVRPISPQEMTKGGIIVPDNAKERSASGVVVAVGPGGYEATKYLLSVSHALVRYFAKEQGFRVALGGIEIVASDFARALDRSLDLHFEDMPVRVGDLVMYGKFSGFEVGVEKLQEIAGGEVVSETETLVVLRAQEIMLVVRPAKMPTQVPEPEVSHVPTESCR